MFDDLHVSMPVHDQIDADGNTVAISILQQFVDWLSDEYNLTINGRHVPIHTHRHQVKLVMEFLGYDADAWLKEKDDLTDALREQFRKDK